LVPGGFRAVIGRGSGRVLAMMPAPRPAGDHDSVIVRAWRRRVLVELGHDEQVSARVSDARRGEGSGEQRYGRSSPTTLRSSRKRRAGHPQQS
jgi:hypothetical protein